MKIALRVAALTFVLAVSAANAAANASRAPLPGAPPPTTTPSAPGIAR